jgi:hypothetical protein
MEWVGSLLSVRWIVSVVAATWTQEAPSEQYDDFCQRGFMGIPFTALASRDG